MIKCSKGGDVGKGGGGGRNNDSVYLLPWLASYTMRPNHARFLPRTCSEFFIASALLRCCYCCCVAFPYPPGLLRINGL